MANDQPDMSRKRKYSKLEPGDRFVVFVHYPPNFTGVNLNEQLAWAKSARIVNFMNGFVVKCTVKPGHLKHFIANNQSFICWHRCWHRQYKVPEGDPDYVYYLPGIGVYE